jgi:hypothetical protein
MPARQQASTISGPEARNIGAAITGSLSLPSKDEGSGIAVFPLQQTL